MSVIKLPFSNQFLRIHLAAYQRSFLGWGARRASQTSLGKYEDRSVQPGSRAQASDPQAATSSDSNMIEQEDTVEGMVDHQPDYNAPIDHGTS